MATLTKQMWDIAQDWAKEYGAEDIDVELASNWAVETGRYTKEPISTKKQCAEDMRRALQKATYIDPQGNEVRTMHALKGYKGQQTTYIDVRIGKPDAVKEAFTQSWNGIANYVKRHAIEKQSWDLNNKYEARLPLFDYNFNSHAEEARMSGDCEYDDTDNEEEGKSDSD